ncbi:MAG: hypothetical protein ACREJO_18650 [Phycisphaerales bacterium]
MANLIETVVPIVDRAPMNRRDTRRTLRLIGLSVLGFVLIVTIAVMISIAITS